MQAVISRGARFCVSMVFLLSIVPSLHAGPFKYVEGTAYHILPSTHSDESGYFSLSESHDGNIHVGTAKYNENAYLVEFDPRTGKQRIVLDTHKTCGLTATGFAAQSKIHTRNFVAPSGRVFVGSKQGYRKEGDTSEYAGGYVMVYDPRVDEAKNLGMPMKGQGVADVVADESRGLLYVITCEDYHWMVGDVGKNSYRRLGPVLARYASTLVDAKGRAVAITRDFRLAQYDPATDKVVVRPILIDGRPWQYPGENGIPTWIATPDRKRAYLILMNDPTLIEIDLTSAGETVSAKSHGKMLEGKNPDSRCALDLHPDGKVYAVIRVDNTSGFGTGFVHHLVRFDLSTKKHEDLGILKVSNPDYFDWKGKKAGGKPPPFSHGFHTLPDGTLTPLHHHMSLLCARDGTIYVTILAPFTLLKIDAFRVPSASTPATTYLDALLASIDEAEKNLPEITRVAELIAQRHIEGGMIGFGSYSQTLMLDLYGRSGGMMYLGFDRPWKKERSEAEAHKDVAIMGFDGSPEQNDLPEMRKLRERGAYLVSFGPREHPALKEHVALSNVWFDTRTAADDRAIDLKDGGRVGRRNAAINATNGWALMCEVTAALTRRGKMPPHWKSFSHPDGKEWGERYFQKVQFHEDLKIPRVAAGELGRRWFQQLRHPIRKLRHTQAEKLKRAADLITEELGQGRKTLVVWQGHMPMIYLGKHEDKPFAKPVELHPFLDSQVKQYRQESPKGALVLAMGYHGVDPKERELWKEKEQRVILMVGGHDDPAYAPGDGFLEIIDLGFAFGDACLTLEGYPLRLAAPSGIAQFAAYEAITSEVRQRAIR